MTAREIGPAHRLGRFLSSDGGGLRARLLRSGVWVGLSHTVLSLLQLARSVILARLLTPDIFGLMALCLTVIRGVELFSETGVRPALIHRRERLEEARDAAFSVMVTRGVILTLVGFALAPLAAAYYEEPQLRTAIRVLAFSFLISGFTNINTVRLERDLDFRRLSLIEQVSSFVSFFVAVGLAYALRSVWALVGAHVVGTAISVLASYLLVPGQPRLRFSYTITKELLRYGRFISGLTIVLFVTSEIDNVVIGKVLGAEQLGYYMIAYMLANLPTTHVSKVLSRLMFPAYSALRDQRVHLSQAYLSTLQVTSMLALPAAAGLFVLAEDIVRVAFGPNWLPAVPALRVLAVFGAFRAVGSINGYLFQAIGRPSVPFWVNLAKLLVVLGVILPATRRYGIVGTALAVTVPICVFYFVSVVILARAGIVSLRENARAQGGAVVAALVMVMMLQAARQVTGPVGVVGLILLVALGAALALGVSFGRLKRLYGLHVAGPFKGVPGASHPAAGGELPL